MRMPDADFRYGSARASDKEIIATRAGKPFAVDSLGHLAHGLFYQHNHIVPSVISVDAGHKIQERVNMALKSLVSIG
jgi:hypothetical protein